MEGQKPSKKTLKAWAKAKQALRQMQEIANSIPGSVIVFSVPAEKEPGCKPGSFSGVIDSCGATWGSTGRNRIAERMQDVVHQTDKKLNELAPAWSRGSDQPGDGAKLKGALLRNLRENVEYGPDPTQPPPTSSPAESDPGYNALDEEANS
jgi:hypothetical protein